MADREKQVELTAMVQKAREALRECERFADEHKLSFSWSPFYGGGGHYEGDPEERWNSDYGQDDGWHSSSMGC